ncbi:hypothetical protein H0I29_03785 [Polaribacter sp. R2A056_3_33]|uniref:hypothetical protein n=1 Tax=Polaribacter sp. R2A056_3_33 TaxID=2745563 RepID=UPI001C4EA2D4|nr:hypothetical protein [Polaribacter sp. R2A056_3_33]QXP71219.1 hypothetical protein H0I29_03785 [Polaribacter sp. R2A056_3_33]
MKSSTFIDLIKNKRQIQEVETAELKTVVEEYPYFQAARVLYLKGLKNQDSFKYNNELKVTASYTTDRTLLFNYITTNNFNNQKEDIHQQIFEKISAEKTVATPSEKIESLIEKTEVALENIAEIETALEIGKPISFSSAENHSFGEWLQLSSRKPIVREEKKQIEKTTIEKPTAKEDLINTFIENNPKIKPLAKDKIVAVPVAKNSQDSSLMTETLAKVYLEQKKYENAMQAYRILSLKYPEKSGFFADQIKRIQILQKNKS